MSDSHDSHIQCPVCHGALTPRVLECRVCDIRVEGHFEHSEFSALAPDDLHFLRVFIACDGRIRDMEAALGVSYPTVKSNLAHLKERLGLESTDDVPDTGSRTKWTKTKTGSSTSKGKDKDKEPPPPKASEDTQSIIEKLERGELDYEAALKQLKDGK